MYYKDRKEDDIMLMKQLNGVRNDLRIFVSLLESYYYMFIEETRYMEQRNKWAFRTIGAYDEEVTKLSENLDAFFCRKEYRKLSDADVKIIVAGVCTDVVSIV